MLKNKVWVGIILSIILLMFNVSGYADYNYTQQSGENYFVGTEDKADALEDTNEVRMILDAFGQLLGHSKYNTTYPADGDTTPGTLTVIDDLENVTNALDSPCIVTGGEVGEGTNAGTFKVNAITEAYLRTSASATAPLVKVTLDEQDNQSIPAIDTTYYVVLTYGTPCTISLSETPPNGYNEIPIGKVIKDSSDKVHYLSGGFRFGDGVKKLHQRARALRAIELESGNNIAYSGTNNFTLTEGIVYAGINRITQSAYDSSTTEFTYIYRDGSGGWTETNSNVIDYAHYDDGDGTLGNIGNNKYGCHWVYRDVSDGHVYVVYGRDSYTLAEAETAPEPTKPDYLTDFGCLIGKIIAPQAGGSFTEVQMVTDTFFVGTNTSNHNHLGGLQGGTAGEYYHLTSSEYSVATIKKKLDATAAPTVDNDIDEGYEIGSRWIDITNDKEYVCLDNTDGAAVWTETTGAGGGASTFTDLIDTPSTYTDAGNKLVAVNSGATALEFITDNKVTQTTQDYTIYCNYSTGSDETGDGTSGNPYKTIQKAIDSLPTIIAHNVTIAVGADETITSPINFIGHYCSASITLEAMDTSDNKLYDYGTATGGSATTLQDTSKSWATDEWNGGWVCIIQGTGVGEVRAITDTTSDTITIESGTAPDSTSDYIIVKVTITGNSVDNGLVGMTDNLNIYGFRWSTFNVYAIKTAFDAGRRTGSVGLNIRYNLFDGGAHGVGIANYIDSTVNSNFFQIPSGKHGIVIGYYAMCYPRLNCFKATTSGEGYGVYVYGLSLASMGGGDDYDNTYINLSKGNWASQGGIIIGGTGQTFINCTTNNDPATASDPAYIQ